MRIFPLLLFLFRTTSAVTHSLKYLFYTSSGVSNLQEFVALGLVDEVQIFHYDSITGRCRPKQEWMEKASEDDPEFWQEQTDEVESHQRIFQANIKTLMQHLHQTEVSLSGTHIFQWFFGCEWNNETKVDGYERIGYDGEDLISFDLETDKWVVSSSLINQKTWDYDKDLIAQGKHHLTKVCPEWLKKYLDYGRSSLMRTDLPSVFLLQRTPSSPVRCFASGFYPERASLSWRKDGDDLYEDVEHEEILPNTDGTFQMSVDLKVSLDKPEDWRRYECVFQLFGVKDDIVTKLDKTAIRTNWEEPVNLTVVVPIATAAILVVILVIGCLMLIRKRRRLQRERGGERERERENTYTALMKAYIYKEEESSKLEEKDANHHIKEPQHHRI